MSNKPTEINASGVVSEIPDNSTFYDGRRYSPLFLEAGKTLTIPARNQMIICGQYQMELGSNLILEPGAKVCLI